MNFEPCYSQQTMNNDCALCSCYFVLFCSITYDCNSVFTVPHSRTLKTWGEIEHNMYCCVTGGLAPQHHASFVRHSVTRPFVLLLNKCY